eukprot:TRINITY_DN3546_c0_g2_i1.p3 TRINITY_DN3546_c0_g2~~TRINITY_DN3546_c0_g2_i1.p3  ORF type:complete len:83 (+),score=6.71 TRINITY_DN3546_c0_g2_i1:225-473(+)
MRGFFPQHNNISRKILLLLPSRPKNLPQTTEPAKRGHSRSTPTIVENMLGGEDWNGKKLEDSPHVLCVDTGRSSETAKAHRG